MARSLYIPKYVATSPPQADVGALREAAKLLVNAENPVIVADRVARTANGRASTWSSSPSCCRCRWSTSAAA